MTVEAVSQLGGTLTATQSLGGSLSSSGSLGARIGNVNFITDEDYEHLINKPSIEGVTLIGNKTFDELGMEELTNEEIEALL